MKQAARVICGLFLLVVLPITSFAITWFPKEFTCPIDNQKNTFLVVGSYGSYIYSYPSKYQWLFFPQTDSPTYYICKKCHLTTFMWDFDKLPKNKLDPLRDALADVKVSKQFEKYTELPVTERLEIMEKVYAVLGKDAEWWENFYRIKGYHYGKSGDEQRAAAARKKSLALIQKELADPKNKSPKKVLLYISGSMKHFLNDDKGALEDFSSALTTVYVNAAETAEEVKNAEIGLNERIKDYITLINSEKEKPRFFDNAKVDEH
jgi:hypothetical protein